MSGYPRSEHDCAWCYGNGCWLCGMTGRADLSEHERGEYDDAMEQRAEHHAELRAEDRMMKLDG